MSASAGCRFCEIPVDKQCPKSNNLTAQLLQYHYLDEFYFYFSKPINEILGETRSPEYAAFRDMLYEVSKPKFDYAFYTNKDAKGKLRRIANKQEKSMQPTLHESGAFKIVLKNSHRKHQIDRRRIEESEDKRRFQRRRNQMPLRDGGILGPQAGFVDPETFDSYIFDIYNPEFSSLPPSPKPGLKKILCDKVSRAQADQSSELMDVRERDKQKVQIPLLCIKSKLHKDFSRGSEHTKGKSKPQTDPNKRGGQGLSDNQSTQFSINCNRGLKSSRRKQIGEEGKRHGGASVVMRTFAKLSSSPRMFKKKRQGDSSVRVDKKSITKKSRDGDSKPRLLATNSLFNSQSWKLIKSWDQVWASKCQEISKAKPEKKSKEKGEDIQSARGLQNSLESSHAMYNTMGLKLSSRKLALSPRIATDRYINQTNRDNTVTYSSFREKWEKMSMKEQPSSIMKRLHKPLWISVGQNPSGETKTRKKTREKPRAKSKEKDKSPAILIESAMLSKNHFLPAKNSKNTRSSKLPENHIQTERFHSKPLDIKGYILNPISLKRDISSNTLNCMSHLGANKSSTRHEKEKPERKKPTGSTKKATKSKSRSRPHTKRENIKH